MKADARPGGYVATGGHGGILGGVNHVGKPMLLYVPAYRHTYLSEVNTRRRSRFISVFSIRIEDYDPVFAPARSILDRAIRSKSCEWKSVLIKTSTCLLLRLVFCAVRGHLVAVR